VIGAAGPHEYGGTTGGGGPQKEGQTHCASAGKALTRKTATVNAPSAIRRLLMARVAPRLLEAAEPLFAL
jgi:hypothetical protein